MSLQWLHFLLVTLGPIPVWAAIWLIVQYVNVNLRRFNRRCLCWGLGLTVLPYPLLYYSCHYVFHQCPNLGSTADLLVMTGTLLLGFSLAGGLLQCAKWGRQRMRGCWTKWIARRTAGQ